MKVKKILFVIALVLGLSSCASMLNPKYIESGYVTDYSMYDMFITEATAVNFDYVPVGSVDAFVQSGYKGKTFVNATPDDAVRVLVEKAKLVGAYGLISVKITYQRLWYNDYKNYVGGYTATGMAIKWD